MGTLTIHSGLGGPISAEGKESELDLFVVDFICSSLLVECVHVRCTSSFYYFLYFLYLRHN